MGGGQHLRTSSPQKQTGRATGESNRDKDSTTSTAESNAKSQSRQDPVDAWANSNGSKNRYYNPDPLARLIGKSNESTIIIDGEQYTTLIDSGAQVTTITVDLVNKLKLPIYRITNFTKLPRYRGEETFHIMGIPE